MKNKLLFALSLLVLWLLLSWSLSLAELITGAVFSVITVLVSDKLFGAASGVGNPLKYLWFVVYGLTLLWDITKACANSFFMLIRPGAQGAGMIEAGTTLKNQASIGILAGTLSLLPGTITVDFDRGRQTFSVYCMTSHFDGRSAAVEVLLAKYERLLKKVFE